MANAATPFLPRDGQVVFSDGSGTPKTFTLNYEDGDFQFTGIAEGQQAHQEFRSRGKVYSVRKVEDQPVEVSFSAHATALNGDGTTATLFDVATFTGAWASAVSTGPNTGDAKLVKVVWTGERTNYGGAADNTVSYKYCRMTVDFAEGVPGKFSVKLTAYNFSTDAYTYV